MTIFHTINMSTLLEPDVRPCAMMQVGEGREADDATPTMRHNRSGSFLFRTGSKGKTFQVCEIDNGEKPNVGGAGVALQKRCAFVFVVSNA